MNQDQTISKDLSLWDQRGSSVLRGQTLVLPIDNSFLYVEPIYITSQTSMPQLKKVALAMGDKLAYADTYEQSLAQLIEEVGGKRRRRAAAGVRPETGSDGNVRGSDFGRESASGGDLTKSARAFTALPRDELRRQMG